MKNGSWEMLPLLCIDPTNAGLTSLDNGEWGNKDDGIKDDDDNDGGKADSEDGDNEGIEYSDGDENY